jgi:hypothetical protein
LMERVAWRAVPSGRFHAWAWRATPERTIKRFLLRLGPPYSVIAHQVGLRPFP